MLKWVGRMVNFCPSLDAVAFGVRWQTMIGGRLYYTVFLDSNGWTSFGPTLVRSEWFSILL